MHVDLRQARGHFCATRTVAQQTLESRFPVLVRLVAALELAHAAVPEKRREKGREKGREKRDEEKKRRREREKKSEERRRM
jgi:hypothetical protein